MPLLVAHWQGLVSTWQGARDNKNPSARAVVRAQQHLDLAYSIRSKTGDERGLLELKSLGEAIERERLAEEEGSKGGAKKAGGARRSLWRRTREVLVEGEGGGGGSPSRSGSARRLDLGSCLSSEQRTA